MEIFKSISLKKCEDLPSLFQNGPKEFHNLRLFDLTKASPTIVENVIQGQYLNNLRWLCLHECMIQKLPTNLFKYCHLQVLHLTNCVDMKELSTSIGQLNALQELHLSGCSSLQELPTSIGQLNALEELHLSGCSSLRELPTSIGQLNALQELHL